MRTIELPGLKVDDAPSLWHDLLKKDFDVESVGVGQDKTFVYLADDEEKDPRPVAEGWAGKPIAELSHTAHLERKKSILSLLDKARACRAERAARRAAAAAAAAAEEERLVKERAMHVPVPVSAPEGGRSIDADQFEPEQPLPPIAAPGSQARATEVKNPQVSTWRKIFRVFKS